MYQENENLFFNYLLRLQEEQKIDALIDEKISAYMQEKYNSQSIHNQLKQEIKEDLMPDIRREIYRVVRECFQTEPLNIQIKY